MRRVVFFVVASGVFFHHPQSKRWDMMSSWGQILVNVSARGDAH
jgi:hypothetical protein